MNVLMIYGGRGLAEDPTLVAFNKIEHVLTELQINIERINLYETSDKNIQEDISKFDALILGTTVDWFGVGKYLVSFLDDCWYYTNHEIFSKLYMMPVIFSLTYGEIEAKEYLVRAWECLGGHSCNGIYGTFESNLLLETNEEYLQIIEKKTEDFYRIIKQKRGRLPNSNYSIINRTRSKTDIIDKQIKAYTNIFGENQQFIKKQKEHIEELTHYFKQKLQSDQKSDDIIETFIKHFNNRTDLKVSYEIKIIDINKKVFIEVNKDKLECYYNKKIKCDVSIQITKSNLDKIINGYLSFQKGFMTGEVIAKGNLNQVYFLDKIFNFKKINN